MSGHAARHRLPLAIGVQTAPLHVHGTHVLSHQRGAQRGRGQPTRGKCPAALPVVAAQARGQIPGSGHLGSGSCTPPRVMVARLGPVAGAAGRTFAQSAPGEEICCWPCIVGPCAWALCPGNLMPQGRSRVLHGHHTSGQDPLNGPSSQPRRLLAICHATVTQAH